MTMDRQAGQQRKNYAIDSAAAPFLPGMAALNVMNGRTERGERFFFELMRQQRRSSGYMKRVMMARAISYKKRDDDALARDTITINVIYT